MSEKEQQDRVLCLLEEGDETLAVCLARAGASQSQLQRWKSEPPFLVRWNQTLDKRDRAVRRLPAPRKATPAAARQVLAAFQEAPDLGLAQHCRVAGTTVKRFEAACAADPRLADLYDAARDALTASVEQSHLRHLHRPNADQAREKFLGRNGASSIWGAPAASKEPAPAVTVNLAVLNAAPKAGTDDDGRFVPMDIPPERLRAADQLPGQGE